MTGPQPRPPRPEWLRVSGPRPSHSAGFFFFIRLPTTLRLLALAERFGEPRQPFCKFIAAGQSQPALLHFEVTLDRRWGQGGFRQLLAVLRMAKALADFFAEVLEHVASSQAEYRRERDRSLSHRRLAQGRCQWGRERTPDFKPRLSGSGPKAN